MDYTSANSEKRIEDAHITGLQSRITQIQFTISSRTSNMILHVSPRSI
jgi:hypothetical protein